MKLIDLLSITFTITLKIEIYLLLGNIYMKKALIKENIPNSLSNDQYKKGYLLERDEEKVYVASLL